ncbi:MAG: ABC transporter permease, partial [Clostridia bacterium]
KMLGLDKSLVEQYFYWVGNMLIGNFGYSSQHRVPVAQLIAAPMGNTIVLNLISLVLVFAITIPLGIITAVKHRSTLDNVVQIGTVIGISLPAFLLSLLFIFVFAVKIRLFPISGMVTAGLVGTPMQMFWDRLHHMCLPLIVMTVSSMAGITRYVRSAMIEALRQDYIRTARAKGLREKVVIYSHAFRNALIPIVTILTMWFVGIFGGSVVIESIFSYNGIGRVLIVALKQLDFSVVLCMNMFYAVLTLLGNLLMDLAYGLVDPRVKLN